MEHPLCAECAKIGIASGATEVDHITPLFKGGDESDQNKQSLCFKHHQAKTRRDLGQRVNGCDVHGTPYGRADW